jgi:TrmH family RNA methyltransferase
VEPAPPHPPPPALSPRNAQVALARRLLRDGRTRREQQAYVVEGPTTVAEALDGGADVRLVLVGLDDDGAVVERAQAVWRASTAAGCVVRGLATHALAAVATTDTPQPALAVVGRSPWPPERLAAALDAVAGPAVVLRLVEVHDPGNAGTLIRSAAAVGAAAVVLDGGVDPTSPKVLRSSAGTAFRLPVVRLDEPGGTGAREWAALRADRGLRSVGLAAGAAVAIDEVDLTGPTEVVVGNEARGLPDALAAGLDELASIPMAGGVESLNAGVAGSVALFELARQRRRS